MKNLILILFRSKKNSMSPDVKIAYSFLPSQNKGGVRGVMITSVANVDGDQSLE